MECNIFVAIVILTEISTQLYPKGHELDPDEFIAKYEQHQQAIEAAGVGTKEEIFAKTRMVSDQAFFLSYKERHTKALPVLDMAIQLWEVHENEWEKPLAGIEKYERLRFYRAVANFRKKRLRIAEREFRWLIASYPENDLYKNWLESIKKQKLNRIANTIGLIGLVAALPHFLFGDSPAADIGFGVFKVCFVVGVCLMVFGYFKYPNKKS